MSVQETSRVWKQSDHKGSALLLMLALADNANDWGFCYPGIEYLSRKLRMSERQVRRLIEMADNSGELHAMRSGRKHLYLILCGLDEHEQQSRIRQFQREFPHAIRLPKSDKMSTIESDNLSGENVTSCHAIPDILSQVPRTIPDIAMSAESFNHQRIIKKSETIIDDSETQERRSAQTIWDTAYGQLQLQMPKEAFDTWLRGARLLEYNSDTETYVLGVPNIYAQQWLEHRLKKIITRTMTQIAGRIADVRFVLWAEHQIES